MGFVPSLGRGLCNQQQQLQQVCLQEQPDTHVFIQQQGATLTPGHKYDTAKGGEDEQAEHP
eukprot:424496-Prorocentrum_lima.AAC.1